MSLAEKLKYGNPCLPQIYPLHVGTFLGEWKYGATPALPVFLSPWGSHLDLIEKRYDCSYNKKHNSMYYATLKELRDSELSSRIKIV